MSRSRATAHEMLSTIAVKLEEIGPPDPDDHSHYVLLGIPCRFIEVAERYYADYVGVARRYYRGKRFPRYQLVWPSNDGHYPWSPKASEPFKAWQAVLGKAPP